LAVDTLLKVVETRDQGGWKQGIEEWSHCGSISWRAGTFDRAMEMGPPESAAVEVFASMSGKGEIDVQSFSETVRSRESEQRFSTGQL
jgi:hypothetical protein